MNIGPHDEPPPAPAPIAAEKPSATRSELSGLSLRRESTWIWWGLFLALAVIVAIATVSALRRNDDRGIRGPADEIPRNPSATPQ